MNMNMKSKIKKLWLITLTVFFMFTIIACDEQKTVDNSQYYLNAPTGVVATKLSNDRIHLTWNAVSGADHYEIKARTNLDSSDTRINIGTTTTTSYEHDGWYNWYWWYYSRPEEVTTIYYYVKAFPRQAGYIASGWSDSVSVKVR